MAAVARDALYVLAKGTLNLSGNDVEDRPPAAGRRRTGDDRGQEDRHRPRGPEDRGGGRPSRATCGRRSPRRRARPRRRREACGRRQERGAAGLPPCPAQPGQTRLPAILKQDQPVSATSDRLDYDGGASHATYTGHAQLWQGETTIKGDRSSSTTRRAISRPSGNVVTTMMLEQVNEKTKAKEQVPSDGEREGDGLHGRGAPRDLHRRRAPERAAGRSGRRRRSSCI